MTIQGGSVTYGRTKNLGDYNSVKAEATISYDDAADLPAAEGLALTAVGKLLGYQPVPLTGKGDEPGGEIDHGLKAEPEKVKKTRKAKIDAGFEEEVPIGEIQEHKAASGVEIEEDFGTDKEVTQLVSDKDLGVAANIAARKIGGDNGGLRVRQLLSEVHGQPNVGLKGLTTPELRALFLKKLAELK